MYLNSIFKAACKQEESSCMVEPLLSQQSVGILQCSLTPSILSEVISKKLGHLLVLLGSGISNVSIETT